MPSSSLALLLFAPSLPEWITNGIIFVIFIIMLGTIAWGGFLEYKYTGPYTLLAASSRQKWRWAVTTTFWQTIMFPLLGLVDPLLNISDPRHWSGFPLFCGGLWLVIFPIGILFKRRKLEQYLKNYRQFDKMIKSGFYQQLTSSPLTSWSFRLSGLFSNAERKRFFEVGYPTEGELEQEVDLGMPSWLVKLTDNTNSIHQWFVANYPDESVLFISKATFLEVGKRSPISWLSRFHQIWGVIIITKESLFFRSKFPSLAMFIATGITIIPLTITAGFLYLIYFLYGMVGFRLSSVLIPLIILLIPALFFLMWSLILGTSIYQYRPHQVQILFQDIQNSQLQMVPGVTRRHQSLTLITIHQTVNIVFTETIPDKIIQLIVNPESASLSSHLD